MKILISPDKFKGSMTAQEVCESIIKGLQKTNKPIEFLTHPLADGGEGSIDILAKYFCFTTVSLLVTDPFGRKVQAYYYLAENKAFIELAVASGLALLSKNEQNPMHTSTLGTGELIKNALEKGVNEIYLFVGGSATNDGGMGLAHALGYRFLDTNGIVLAPIGKNLTRVAKIESTFVKVHFTQVKIILLTDVTNPLVGQNGSAYVYASQKGASAQEVKFLNQGLTHFSALLRKQTKINVANLAGAGAAGGVAVCLVGLLNARIQSGVKKIMEWTKFEQKLAQADLVISGEGQLDVQSFEGKVVGEILALSQKHHKPVLLFVGSCDLTDHQVSKIKATKILSILDVAQNLDEAMEHGAQFLTSMASKLNLNH